MTKNTDIFIKKVERFIAGKSLMKPTDKVLVAISGGSDSVCLLHTLLTLGYRVAALHCNFRLRGEESERDERFVRELCTRLGVELTVRSFDTAGYASHNKVSIEMAARELRYAFFAEELTRQQADVTAVAHHIDDNTETFILNAIRGTGVRGLAAIQPRNGNIVRPLLCVSHSEILEELKSCRLDYVTDSSNLEDHYSRNKVRLNIMPLMKEINASAPANIMTTIDNMQEMLKIYDSYISNEIRRCTVEKDGETIIDLPTLQQSASPLSVLHEIMSPMGFNRTQETNILHFGESGRTFRSASADGSDTFTALVDRHTLIIRKDGETRISPTPLYEYPAIEVTEAAPPVPFSTSPQYAYIDADKVDGTLYVRTTEPGDRFHPFGMKGKKLVSDYLTDCKKSLFSKERQLVVCDSRSIVWVVGQRSSELHRVDSATRHILILKCNNPDTPTPSEI